MNTVFLLVGSNHERFKNIKACHGLLNKMVRVVSHSSVYETLPQPSPSVGKKKYYNIAYHVESEWDKNQFKENVCYEIERQLLRERLAGANARVTIDVDIVFLEEQPALNNSVYFIDQDMLRYDYVQIPLQEVVRSTTSPRLYQKLDQPTCLLKERTSIKKIDFSLFEA